MPVSIKRQSGTLPWHSPYPSALWFSRSLPLCFSSLHLFLLCLLIPSEWG
jgi:hypothetical protein